MSCFKPFLSGKSKVEFVIPKSVVDFMNGFPTRQQLLPIHRPMKTQRKRSVASGVVFSDCPLETTNETSIFTTETEDRPHSVTVDVLKKVVEPCSTPALPGMSLENCYDNVQDIKLAVEVEKDDSQEPDSEAAGEWVSVKVESECEDIAVYNGDEDEEDASHVECAFVDLTGHDNDVRQMSPHCKRILPTWLDHPTPSTQPNKCCQNEPKRPASNITQFIKIEIYPKMESYDSDKDKSQFELCQAKPELTGKGDKKQTQPRPSHCCCPTIVSSPKERIQTSPINPTVASTEPSKSQSTAMTLYERVYVGRNCDFARRIMFGDSL